MRLRTPLLYTGDRGNSAMKFALIGSGAQGLAYAAAAAELGLDLVLCADPRAAAAKKAAAFCRGRATTSCNSALAHKDIHALLLCAPPRAIPGYLRLAAKAGKHALVASTLTHDSDAMCKALDAARAAGIHAHLAHDSRVAPHFAALFAQLDQRAIGRPGFIRVVRVGASPGAKSGPGALASLLPGDLDWLVMRFGARPRVFAQSAHAPAIDHAATTLTFADGPIVQWVGTCRAREVSPRASIEICGDAGMIQFTTDDLILESTAAAGKSPQHSSPLAQSLVSRHLGQFAALLSSAPLAETCDHDTNVLRVLGAVVQSAESGKEIRL